MKILLVQSSFLGDTILATPVVAAIKAVFPASRLTVLCRPPAEEFLARDPLIDQVLLFDKRGSAGGLGGLWRMAAGLRRERFDRVYSLHRSARSSLLLWLAGIPVRIGFAEAALNFLYTKRCPTAAATHAVIRNLAILKGEDIPADFGADLRLFPASWEDLPPARQKLLPQAKPYVALIPGSVWPTKRWSTAGYRAVARHFLAKGYPVLILGSATEEAVCQEVAAGLGAVDLAGQTTVLELLTMLNGAALVVCNDSMALHAASAFKIPTVAVFCATDPRFGFGPWCNPWAQVVEKTDLPCKPCRPHGSRRCPTGTEACMRELPAVEVIAAAERVLVLRAERGAADVG